MSNGKFCPICGKIGISGRFCDSCAQSMEKTKKAKELKIIVCCACSKYLYRNNWSSFLNLNDMIDTVVSFKYGKANFELPKEHYNPGEKLRLEIVCDKTIVPVYVEFTVCKLCGKDNVDYLEGILQLRNPRKEILDYVRKLVDALGNRCFINKEVRTPGGVDLYFSSIKCLSDVSSKLVSRFGGEMKKSRKLFSKDKNTSKPIYRLTVYYKPFDFSEGDVIKVQNKIIKVKSLGKYVTGINLMTRRKASVRCTEYEKLRKRKTTVSKVFPNIEIIDPENYQSISAVNSKDDLQPGEHVVVVYSNGYYLV